MRLDRWLNLLETPAFLRPVQPKERAWWRILLTLVLWVVIGFPAAMLAFITVVGLEVLVLRQTPLTLRLEEGFPVWGYGLTAEVGRLFYALAVFGSLALVIAAVAALVNRRPMKSWLTAAPHFRWRLFLTALVAFAAVMTLGMMLDGVLTGWPDHPPLLDLREPLLVRCAYAAAVLLVAPVAALSEEILTRGWLMQLTSALTRNIVAIVGVNAAVFAAMHFDPNPLANLARFYTGVALSLMVLRLGGLEFAIGVQAANSLMVALFQQPLIQPGADNGGGWQTLVSDIAVTTAALLLAELVARWRPLRRWTGVAATDEASAEPEAALAAGPWSRGASSPAG